MNSTELPAAASGPTFGGFSVESGLVAEVVRTEVRDVPGVVAVIRAGAAGRAEKRSRWWFRLWDWMTGTPREIAGGRVMLSVTVVAEYGPNLPALADAIRERLAGALNGLTGLGAAGIDVVFSDLHVPGEPLPLPEPRTVPAAAEPGHDRLDF